MTSRPALAELTIGYSSLASRLPDLQPPADPAPEVLVCVQGALAPGSLHPRVDQLVDVPGRGVARSRNAAIDHAGRRYLLFCDDDVQVDLDGVARGVERLRASGAALALGRGADPEGRLRKTYPSDEVTPLSLRNTGRAATYEMLVDLGQVRDAGVRFDERFGAGVPLYLGDEYIFCADLLAAGLKGIAVPDVFGIHPEVSSGSRWGGADSAARAQVLNRVFGRRAPAARAAFAWKHRGDLGGLLPALRFAATRRSYPDSVPGGDPARVLDRQHAVGAEAVAGEPVEDAAS